MKKRSTKILLVDDEPDILEIIGYNFWKKGTKFEMAKKEKKAI